MDDKARRVVKKFLFWLALLLFNLCVIELLAHVTHHLLFDQGVASSLDGLQWDLAVDSRSGRHGWAVLHPVYGFVDDWRLAPLNFMPPEGRREGTLIIALMGGSVAGQVVGELRNALFRHFLESGAGVVPVLVDLSGSAFHQPQQAAVLANMMANGTQFDVVVLLDGYNEAAGPAGQATAGLHPAFPIHWSSLVSMSSEQAQIVRQILELRDEERNLRKLDAESVLGNSAVFRVIWRFRLTRIERRIALGHHELRAAAGKRGLEKHGPRGRYTEDILPTVGPRLWYESSRLIGGLAERHGAEYYHFIQPNRHVPNSKPLSADELAMFNEGDASSWAVPEGYRQMREYGHLLGEHGVHFFDLSWIYQDRPETLYKDYCCHLNKRGNELLANAMLRRIVGRTSHWASSSLEGEGGPAVPVRSVFDVYRLGTALGYAKTPCVPADTQATFILQVTPAVRDDLPPKHGLDNFDFSFARMGTVFGDLCVATVPLPNYTVAHVKTGQDGALPWNVEFSL